MADSHSILVVEDDPDVLRIIEFALCGAGYHVLSTTSGEEAIALAKAQHFDLILTDLAMPQVSGVDVIRALKTSPGVWRVPIIAVTAYWTGKISVNASDAGVDGFIAKPFSKEELLYEVEKHLRAR